LSGARRYRVQARLVAACAGAGLWFGAPAAHAQDASWVGGNAGDPHEWVEPANWTPATVPGGTATFGAVANTTSVANDAGTVSVGTINFTATALAYTFSIDNAFAVNATGVVNNSANTQTFNVASGKTLTFQNSSSASGGTGPVTYNNAGGKMVFNNSSTAGSANIASSFSGTNASVTFNNSSSAGSATFTSNPANFPTYTFNNTSTAANAHFVLIDATLVFNNSSNAGNAIITMPNLMHPATVTFNDTSSAGNANITNISSFGSGGIVQFLGASTAGNATITNNPNPFFGGGGGGQLMFGQFGGGDTANAGTATIINNSGGSTTFVQFTSAASANITNNSGGGTTFEENSTAANAHITNNSGGGLTFFAGAPTAGNAVIVNNAGGEVDFGIAGLYPIIIDTATAGNATITNSGTVVFSSQTTAGNATITTNAGGTVSFVEASTGGSARFIMNAGGVFDMSGLTTGGMTAGSIEGAGNVFLGGKALTVGLNNLSTVFSGVISDGGAGGGGGGQLIKTGTGNLTLTNIETYTGATTVNGGTLTVNGSLAASSGVTVNSGGTLAGTGTVATTTVNSGGTLAPGNGNVGTLTVNGSLTFNAGSIFLVDVTPTTASKVQVNGTASLNGTVDAVFLPGSYLTNSYTILTATGGRTGTFSNLVTTGLPAFLTASLAYDPNDVMLVTLHSNLNRAGLTQNQAAVAAALDNSFNTGHGTLSGLSFVTPAQLPAALNALSGESTSGTQETAFGAANLFLTTMMEQGQFWRTGTGAAGATSAPLGYAPDPSQAPVFKAMPVKAPLLPPEPLYRAWTAGFDGTWRLDGQADPGSADLKHNTAGGAAGLDYQVNHNLLVGVAAGGSTSTFSVPDRATSGTLDGAHFGAYGVARWDAWYAAGALAFNAFDNRLTRPIVGVGPTEIATGTFNSDMLSGRFEVGYKQAFNGFTVTPFAAVQFAELWQPGYTESSITLAGAPGVNGLTYSSQTVSSLPTFLGAQFDTRVVLANGAVWSPYARLSWVHEFEPNRDINAGFITLPVTNFTVFGPSAARDAARIDFGSKLTVGRNTALFASFDGEFSDRSQMYAGRGGLKVTW
jgi:outer membrane autotransporter protein